MFHAKQVPAHSGCSTNQNNKIMKHIIITLFFIFSHIASSNETLIDARDITLYQTYIKVIDKETKQPIKISVIRHQLKISNYLKKDNSIDSEKSIMELTNEKFKITWIDLKNQKAKIMIQSEGYKSVQIPDNYIMKINGERILGGFYKPKIIEMEKLKK
ncbi:hypothetical protein LNTAR_19167 [Lentisphaera araneosa HTCC2155]|uniref:Uncharacterized protein n=1 Tax=Lentisphaera araneosa HTCC2155 TaxID=313628 RepID=A6DQP9_9BACT|nr:hypothetical protein [Lentisphaera araneosa]EDM25949.1 hypothetical protein LNTAR_19167 [Lentisphaera araneosa HTCC2155]